MNAKEYIHKRKAWCSNKHLKSFGESALDNMNEIIKIDHDKNKKYIYSYGIYECCYCGKRSFGCIGAHLLPLSVEEAIDNFIQYQISEDELIAILDKEGMAYKQNDEEVG